MEESLRIIISLLSAITCLSFASVCSVIALIISLLKNGKS